RGVRRALLLALERADARGGTTALQVGLRAAAVDLRLLIARAGELAAALVGLRLRAALRLGRDARLRTVGLLAPAGDEIGLERLPALLDRALHARPLLVADAVHAAAALRRRRPARMTLRPRRGGRRQHDGGRPRDGAARETHLSPSSSPRRPSCPGRPGCSPSG